MERSLDDEVCILKLKVNSLEKDVAAADRALTNQAKEYERRLDALNHEAQKLNTMQATYMPREVHDAQIQEMSNRIDVIQKFMWIAIGVFITVEFFLKIFKP